MDAEVTALLQVYGAAIAALCATHPDPARLRSAFETIVSEEPNPHPLFLRTFQVLQAAIDKSK